MQTQIQVPSDFNFEECLVFLDRNSDEILYAVENGEIRRLISIDGKLVVIQISHEEGILVIHYEGEQAQEKGIQEYVERWFDTLRNLNPFYTILAEQPALSPLSKYKGLRIIGVPDLFESLCWTIIGQQINLAFAYKLKNRLTQHFGHSEEANGQRLWHFPQPTDLLEIDDDFREANQFSRSKIKYLMNTAQAFADGTISLDKIRKIEGFEDRQAYLTQVKGIGEWSANYALMKTLHQAEAIPYGDTGLTQALYNLKIIKDRKDRPAIEAFFETVKGWEAYTSFYLWRSLY